MFTWHILKIAQFEFALLIQQTAFSSFVHQLCNSKKPCSTFLLRAGMAKQNCANFSNARWLAVLIPVLKYAAHPDS
jgi:hypothetical protein